MKLTRIALTALALLALAGAAVAQEQKQEAKPRRITLTDPTQYTVSAKAGAVNIAEGDVAYKRTDGDWDLLIAGDDLKSGDAVKIGATGRAEILLNPGSYLRIFQNTELVFVDTSLDTLKIEILKGSAIIEAAMADGEKGPVASILTPHGELYLALGGLYRFNVDGARTVAMVRKGKLVAPQPGTKPTKGGEWVAISSGRSHTMVPGIPVKGGRQIIIENGATNIVAFDKKAEDEFDTWSKDRAQTLIAANKRLSNRVFTNSSIARRMISRWGSSGWWVYNPYSACWAFMPSYWGYSSPYGWSYPRCHNPYPRNNGWNGGSGGMGGSGGSTGGGTGSTRGGGTGSGGGIGGGTHSGFKSGGAHGGSVGGSSRGEGGGSRTGPAHSSGSRGRATGN